MDWRPSPIPIQRTKWIQMVTLMLDWSKLLQMQASSQQNTIKYVKPCCKWKHGKEPRKISKSHAKAKGTIRYLYSSPWICFSLRAKSLKAWLPSSSIRRLPANSVALRIPKQHERWIWPLLTKNISLLESILFRDFYRVGAAGRET